MAVVYRQYNPLRTHTLEVDADPPRTCTYRRVPLPPAPDDNIFTTGSTSIAHTSVSICNFKAIFSASLQLHGDILRVAGHKLPHFTKFASCLVHKLIVYVDRVLGKFKAS